MKTVKLFENDSYMRSFEANVISCREDGGVYEIILDRTCFFPESAGQPCDLGKICGADVTDVQYKNGEIVHFCSAFFAEGSSVTGEIDFKRRFSFMQNHSGEHIVSGIVDRLYGLDNVGFHLNCECVTLDFNGLLSKQQLEEAEYLANRAVWEDRVITAYYPRKEELGGIRFRRKSGICGDIRLVDIEGIDVCACCAPHVARTGQIGLIKLLGSEKMRGGVRVYMKCGDYALRDYGEKQENTVSIGGALSVKANESYAGVLALIKRLEEQKTEISALKKQLVAAVASGARDNVLLVEGFGVPELQALADMLYKKTGEIHTVFSETDKGQYSLVICGDEAGVKTVFDRASLSLDIKGGGRNGMMTCRVLAAADKIKKEFTV